MTLNYIHEPASGQLKESLMGFIGDPIPTTYPHLFLVKYTKKWTVINPPSLRGKEGDMEELKKMALEVLGENPLLERMSQ